VCHSPRAAEEIKTQRRRRTGLPLMKWPTCYGRPAELLLGWRKPATTTPEVDGFWRPFPEATGIHRDRCGIHGLLSHNITQHPGPSFFSNIRREALVAASNTSSTPSPLRLEHSRYFRAPISLAMLSPSWGETKRRDFLRISSMATGSSRRSFFRPTRIIGTPGHRSFASTTHCDR